MLITKGETDMYTCASCTVLACANNEPDKMPKNCPMRNTSVMENSRDGYDSARKPRFLYQLFVHRRTWLLPVAPAERNDRVL